MNRTHRWLRQSVDYHNKYPASSYGDKQALFGILQGGFYQELRQESAAFITSMNCDGIAIGGETIGFDMDKTVEVLRWVINLLPEEKPRYTMGVGMSPQDLLDVVEQGVDMFDCVAPTRNARHGALYCGEVVKDGNWLKFASPYDNARIQIKKSCYAADLSPVMQGCSCYTCSNYSRAYLHQLCKQKTNLFTALASIHNVHVLHDVCAKMRALIIAES
jgi:queuine tRNA-ribosyltransferase